MAVKLLLNGHLIDRLNVLYVEPIAENIQSITFSCRNDEYLLLSKDSPHSKVNNTYITTKSLNITPETVFEEPTLKKKSGERNE